MLRDHHGRGEGCDGRKQARCGLARILDQKLIHDNDGCHCFDDGDSTRHHTRIMTASGGQSPWSSIILSGVLHL